MALPTKVVMPHGNIPTQFGPTTSGEAHSGKQSMWRRYLLLLSIPVLLVYVAVFPLVRVAKLRYDRWGMSKWGPILNFPFEAQHLDADIVIFGDSTAFLGVDPRIINQDLGLHTLVIPNTIGSLHVVNDLALERYLQRNRRPRLLVFYFAAWNLDYSHDEQKNLVFEGEEILLRNGTWSDIGFYAEHHPLDLLMFPFQQLNSTLRISKFKEAFHADRAADTFSSLGHRDYTEPWATLDSSCIIPNRYIDQSTSTSVQLLMRKYQQQNFTVAVYLAPVPSCTNAHVVTDRMFSDVRAAHPIGLPASSFANDGFYGHVRPPSVAMVSHLFAQSIRPYAEAASACKGGDHSSLFPSTITSP